MKKQLKIGDVLVRFPELLAFATEGVQATNDYDVTKMTQWMQDLYKDAQTVKEEVLKRADIAFLKPFLEKTVLPQKRTIELERTMLSLMTLEAIANKDYSFFTETTQPLFGKPLSKEQFDKIVEIFKQEVKDPKIVELSLVLGDIGKIKPLREALCKEFDITKQDPDEFLGELLKQDFTRLQKLLPLFEDMSKEDFEALKKAHIDLHFGHFVHTECNNVPLRELGYFLKKSLDNWTAFYAAFIVQLCDVAGAAAQAGGKTILNEVVALTYLDGVLPAVEKMKDGCDGEEAYEAYLKFRLAHAGMKAEAESFSENDYWLARFICMMRVYNHEAAVQLKVALAVLFEKEQFNDDLGKFETYESDGVTPTYIPALIGQLLKEKKHEEALRLTMRVVAIACTEQMKGSWDNPANFNGLTGLARDNLNDFLVLVKSGKVHVADDGMVSKAKDAENIERVGFMQEDARERDGKEEKDLESKVVFE